MKREMRTVPLTIFLLKDAIKEGEAIDPEAKAKSDSVAIELEGKQIGTLYTRQNPDHLPGWVRFFEGSVDISRKRLKVSSVSAAFVIRSSGRLFVVTFGHGRHLINEGFIEERFGLRVTLNSVDADQLRAVDVTTLEANPFHSKRQAAKAAPLGEFGLNLDQDLLRGVTGKPKDEKLGSQMAGTDSLSVRVQTDLKKLKPLLAKYLEKSNETSYREKFAWVDHVAQVRDEKMCDQLFRLAIIELGKKEPKKVWAAIPEAIDWTLFDFFQYGAPSKKIRYDDVTLVKMKEALDGFELSKELLATRRISCMVKGMTEPYKNWSFLHCLTAELELHGEAYLLNAGSWYKIAHDYVSEVGAAIAKIEKGSLPLTDWGEENEVEYNARMARKSGGTLALMDKVMIAHPGMPSPIEFCDLYSNDGKFIHVKRYGQSAVLSHLFSQGLVSATSSLSDPAFKKEVNKKLPVGHQFKEPEKRISPNDYEVCFVIGSSEYGDLSLPFFSRVTLRNVYRMLTQNYGFKVSLTKIQVSKLTNIK